MRAVTLAHASELGNIFDLDNYTDAVVSVGESLGDAAKAVYNAVSDAGHAIGAVLKFVAPIIALWPGIGTGISIALSAAAAYANGDAIADGIVDTISAAVPGGVPRLIFDGGATITKAAIRGENVKEAAIGVMRNTAASVGGDRGKAAFDAGLAVARGANGRDALWAGARSTAQQWGTAPLAAFDAAVAVKNGGDAEDAIYAAARDYIGVAGGPAAQGIFDAGVAIRRGKDLQDAGFLALQDFVAGNGAGERALNFAQKVTRAYKAGKSVAAVVEEELVADVGYLHLAKQDVSQMLGPLLARWSPQLNEWGSYALAIYEALPEPLARAAQAIMRDPSHPDDALAKKLTESAVQQAIEKYGIKAVASNAQTITQAKAEMKQDQLTLALHMPASTLTYASAVATPAVGFGRVTLLVPAPSAAVISQADANAPDPNADPVQVAEPPAPAPRTGTVGNVALGVTIAGAIVALAWWSTSK